MATEIAKTGTILIVEDDSDDKELIEQTVVEMGLKNKVLWYDNSTEALDYLLADTEPVFIIFSDVNLPGQTGLQFKKTIDSIPELRRRSIPFVFYSTWAYEKDVETAFIDMTVQGFFKKGRNYTKIREQIELIIRYWQESEHPG